MAQTPCIKIQAGDVIPDPSTTTRTGGDVVVLGTIPFVCLPTDPNLPGKNTLATDGVYDVPKDASTFTAGDAAYWNATGSPVTGTASSGAATSTASGANLMGVATKDAATGDSYVRVKLTAAQRTTTVAGSVTADDVTGSDSSLGIVGLAATQGGTIAIAGGASAGGNNNGGPVTVRGGAKNGTGVDGTVTIGDATTSAVTIGAASVPVVTPGPSTCAPGGSTAAAGTTTSDAGALPAGTARVYPTTGADDTKGVVVNAADKVTGRMLFIGNGVSNKILKVYPPSGGTINGAAGDAAFSSASGKGVILVCLSSGSNTWLGW